MRAHLCFSGVGIDNVTLDMHLSFIISKSKELDKMMIRILSPSGNPWRNPHFHKYISSVMYGYHHQPYCILTCQCAETAPTDGLILKCPGHVKTILATIQLHFFRSGNPNSKIIS